MKAGIHPEYRKVKVTCSCGAVFEVGSTSSEDLVVEICSACHPFYTGKQKLVDTAGRLQKFQERMAKAEEMSKQTKKANKKEKKAEVKAEKKKVAKEDKKEAAAK